MRKFGISMLMLVFAAFVSNAQPGGGRQFSPEDMAKRQTEQLGEYVKLSTDLQKKVYDVNFKYAQKSRELYGGRSPMDMSDSDRQKMREKRDALNKERDGEMKKIMTPEQFKGYEKYQAEARQRMQQRRQ
jgi:periplasmic protein CpxP/Spy